MYRIMVTTAGETFPLHDVRDGETQVDGPVVDLEVGKTGSLRFSVPAVHPYADKIQPLASEFHVYNGDDLIFCGRHVGNQEDFYRTRKIECEGELSYLLDSIQRPYEFKGNIPDFFYQCLAAHNSQVESRKQFVAGDVTVIDSNNYINRSNSRHSTTMETMQEKLVNTHGGYLRVRHAGSIRYLDYVSDYGGINSQVIRFGENLMDLSRHIDPTGIITALIPVGAELDDGTRVSVTAVNGGKDYIFDQAAVERYGWIWGTMEWEDVTLPENLLRKARAYLQECTVLPVTLELNALDMALLEVDAEKLKLGYWTRVESPPHGVSADFLLSKMHIDLESPVNNTVTLGRVLPTFTGSSNKQVMAVSAKVDRMGVTLNKNIERAVDNATKLITGGTGGYVVLDIEDENGECALPWRILIMDSPDKNQAKSVIQLNRNGIGFSTTGIGGPYRNAWTIDGHLVADFITTGTMLADRIRGGTLELGGFGNQGGVVIMRDASGKEIGRWDKDGLVATKGSFPAGLISGKIKASQIDATDLKVNAANITGTLTANQINTESLTINGKQITAGSIGTERFNSGVSSWVGDIAADKIKTVELSADRIYPNHEGFIWFPHGPVLVTRLQIDRGSSVTCVDGMCGTNDYPFAQGWFGSINGSSSRKLKKDIKSYSGGLEVVMKTDVKKYRMKNDKTGRIRFGFISEDAPEELATSEREGIDLYNCIGVAFNAIQELQGQINKLKGGSVA